MVKNMDNAAENIVRRAEAAEEARVQAIRDDLDRRYREEEEREHADRAARLHVLRKRGEEILRSTVEFLLDGEHRAAWQTLHATGDDGQGCAESRMTGYKFDGSHCPAIESDAVLRLNANELERRIDWSYESEEHEQARITQATLLRSADLIDFDELDRQLAQSSVAENRPAEIGVIYSVSMPDGEVYIGKTSRDVEVRWSEHRREAESGDMKPKSRALRYWRAQGRADDIRWKIEETVLGWSEEDLASAEKRWMRMGTLNVMDATRVATLYPNV